MRPVSAAEANTIEAPTVGFADVSTSTSVEYVDLSDYAGGYVTISCETDTHYIAFGPSNSFTMDVDAAAVGTNYVAFPVTTSEKFSCVVHADNPFMAYRTLTSGAAIIRVHKS